MSRQRFSLRKLTIGVVSVLLGVSAVGTVNAVKPQIVRAATNGTGDNGKSSPDKSNSDLNSSDGKYLTIVYYDQNNKQVGFYTPTVFLDDQSNNNTKGYNYKLTNDDAKLVNDAANAYVPKEYHITSAGANANTTVTGNYKVTVAKGETTPSKNTEGALTIYYITDSKDPDNSQVDYQGYSTDFDDVSVGQSVAIKAPAGYEFADPNQSTTAKIEKQDGYFPASIYVLVKKIPQTPAAPSQPDQVSQASQATQASQPSKTVQSSSVQRPAVKKAMPKLTVQALKKTTYVYNAKGQLVKTHGKSVKMSRAKLAKALQHAKVVTIKGKKYFQVAKNQFVKAANLIVAVKVNKKVVLKGRKNTKIRVYNKHGRLTLKTIRGGRHYKLSQKVYLHGKVFYKIAGKNIYLRASQVR